MHVVRPSPGTYVFSRSRPPPRRPAHWPTCRSTDRSTGKHSYPHRQMAAGFEIPNGSSTAAQAQMSEPVTAQTRMKALVMSRLLMGDISRWDAFEQERKAANQITNRRTARSVSSQIGRGYRELAKKVRSFIDEHFIRCEYVDLARLGDAITIGTGMSLWLDEFEKRFFPLSEPVKGRFPSYAHVHISTYGLKFEFPEHHFLRDIETSLPELLEARSQLSRFGGPDFDAKRECELVADLVAKDNFLSRSIISAAFSLAEAYLSGLFCTAVHAGSLGRLTCTEEFLGYVKTKESAPLRDRIDRVVRFASNGAVNGNEEPFRDFIEWGSATEMRSTIQRPSKGRTLSLVAG
jgi:hypothetical protein